MRGLMAPAVVIPLLLLCVGVPVRAVAVSFEPARNVSIETPSCVLGVDCPDAPLKVVSGDFDGNGTADVATANNASDNVAVLLGDGAGDLSAHVAVGAGAAPSGIAVGRINADEFDDLAVANELGNTVSILLGAGDGAFRSAGDVAVGNSPEGIVLADFNRDGRLDIATADLFGDSVTDPEDDTVSVLLGNGDGTFKSRLATAVAGGPYGIAAGDLDGDQVTDLAVTLGDPSRDQVAVLIGQGNGSFTPGATLDVGAFPVAVVIGDFDADGTPDLAVANEFSDDVAVLLGEGGGAFGSAAFSGVGGFPEALAAGDLDGDGRLDLVTADSFGTVEFPNGTVSVLAGMGDGRFAQPQFFGVGLSPFGVVLTDLNTDGRLDVVTSNLDGNNVSVLINTSAGAPCVGDCNADGMVSIDELVVGINIALGNEPPDRCTSLDADDDGQVWIDELTAAVRAALLGCGA